MRIILDIPENVELDVSEYDIKMLLACKLYEEGILDTGYAAKSIGMKRADFILEMGKYGKSIFDIPEEEIERDMKNAAKFIR
jgi:predicted HTH domain antitoxin